MRLIARFEYCSLYSVQNLKSYTQLEQVVLVLYALFYKMASIQFAVYVI